MHCNLKYKTEQLLNISSLEAFQQRGYTTSRNRERKPEGSSLFIFISYILFIIVKNHIDITTTII